MNLRSLVPALFALALAAGALAQPIVFVWYPNESTPEFAPARAAIMEVVASTLGRPVREQLTTDYAIAIEAIANENAALSWFGAEGYIQANARERAVQPLVVNTTASGSLDDAKYYAMLGVMADRADEFKVDGAFSLDKIRQTRFSFVSNSSASGFRVPGAAIATHFGVDAEDLLLGGPRDVFAEVSFGGSHQGAFYNVLTDKADVAAFCNACVAPYVDFVTGAEDDPVAGDLIRVKAGAAAPFDQVPGLEVVFIATYPVLNAPLVVNTNLLDAAAVEALRVAFTSDAVRTNPAIFGPAGSSSFFREGNQFVRVEDAWFDPIRRLAGN
jgi:phosphonate transport system substrate-binding protein